MSSMTKAADLIPSLMLKETQSCRGKVNEEQMLPAKAFSPHSSWIQFPHARTESIWNHYNTTSRHPLPINKPVN